MTLLQKSMVKILVVTITTLLSSIIAATTTPDFDFRWVVQNATSKEIRGIVGTSHSAWDVPFITSTMHAATVQDGG